VTDLDALRYPLGRFERLKAPLDRATRDGLIATLDHAPARFRALAGGLGDAQLDTAYRPGGWTIRQVVHHVPESHMNAYIRMKWAMTEDTPAIKTYEEQLWAELPDARSGSVDTSLALLEALHRRWVQFLRLVSDVEFRRAFVHPQLGPMPIEEALAMYAWHSRHHAAHIEHALGRV
jgi:DinB family protein